MDPMEAFYAQKRKEEAKAAAAAKKAAGGGKKKGGGKKGGKGKVRRCHPDHHRRSNLSPTASAAPWCDWQNLRFLIKMWILV